MFPACAGRPQRHQPARIAAARPIAGEQRRDAVAAGFHERHHAQTDQQQGQSSLKQRTEPSSARRARGGQDQQRGRQVERGRVQSIGQAQGRGRNPQRRLARQGARSQPQIDHDGDRRQRIILHITEEELHSAQAEQQAGHEQALAAAAAHFPGQLQHYKDVDRARDHAGDGVRGKCIRPLPKTLTERP